MSRILYLLISLCLFSNAISAQENIFFEDFSGVVPGTGYPSSSDPSVPLGLGDAYKGTANFFPYFGRFSVSENTLQADAVVGEVKWKTNPIDISCYSNVTFSANFTESGNLNASQEGTDEMDYIAIDLTFVEDNFTIEDFFFQAGSFGSLNFASSIPINTCGNPIAQNIVLTFRFANDKVNEGQKLHQVSVTGNSTSISDFNFSLNCDNVNDQTDLEVTANSACFPEFSLDNTNFSSSGLFENLSPGTYTVSVRDHYFPGCSLTSFPVTIPSCFVLPIDLISFTGQPQGQDILLRWETAQETNNDYMIVEHSLDGIDFRQIGTVRGAGTTSKAQSYQFLDRQAIVGINYYRLQQVDFDGTTAYHQMIAVEMDREFEADQISLYPTVASDQIRIDWRFRLQHKMEYTIFSMTGQSVVSGVIQPETSFLMLPLDNLPKGTYVFNLNGPTRTFTRRFVKQ